MAQRQIILRRPYLSLQRTLRLRVHSETTDGSNPAHLLSPIKLKTQNSKQTKTSSNRLPIMKESSLNIQQILKKAKALFSEQKFEEVIPYLKQLLSTSKEAQSLYYLGCSFLYKQKYEHSIYYLNLLVEKEPNFNRNSFIMLAVAYKELNLYKAAIKILNKCLQIHKNFEQAVIYLAKLHIKTKQYDVALNYLEPHIRRSPSTIFRLTYADCLRLNNRLQESITHYNIVCEDQDLGLVGLLKRMTLLYQLREYGQSLADCNKLIHKRVQSSEVYYFKGMNFLNLKPEKQFPVEFSRALDLNNHVLAVTKSLCQIVKNHILRKDIYAAEAEIKRTDYLNIKEEEIKHLRLFVEGAIDCVKKRPLDAIPKLLEVEKCLKSSRSLSYSGVLEDNVNVYLGYAYFMSSSYKKAIKCYESQPSPSTASKYNKLLCEGIVYHQNNEFLKCIPKFTVAKSLLPHFQPYFYLGINNVQQYFIHNQPEFLDKAIYQLEGGLQFNPPSLYYFYLSLVMIQAKKPAEQMISMAIQKSDDNVADYYFVRGIIEAQNDLSIALNDFTSAIQMLKIPAYYKQRSKCFYQLGMYSSAIEDLLKIMSTEKDYEAAILLCFNYYANQEFQLALTTLQEASISQQNRYLIGLKIALNIHLKNYKKAGTLGEIISSIEANTKILDQKVLDKFSTLLSEKYSIGQFDIVELLCLGGAYHFVFGDYQNAQICFYNALTELKQQLTRDSSIDFGTEAKIYQSKFNIALSHLMMKEYEDSQKLLQVLIEETESQSTVDELKRLLQFVNEEIDRDIKMSILADEVVVDIFPSYKLLSENFPVAKMRFKSAVLVIKPILFYPQKLRFNIFPELNPRFLKDFGMWKVENTPEPPWVIRQGSYFKFTNDLDLQSPVIQYTDTNFDPQSSIEASNREDPNRYSGITKEELRLPDQVNQKLEKIIHNKNK